MGSKCGMWGQMWGHKCGVRPGIRTFAKESSEKALEQRVSDKDLLLRQNCRISKLRILGRSIGQMPECQA